MTKIYTRNSLVKYVYDECDLFEMLEIEHALQEDANLKLEYLRLLSAKHSLKNTTLKAPLAAVENILQYAKSAEAQASY